MERVKPYDASKLGVKTESRRSSLLSGNEPGSDCESDNSIRYGPLAGEFFF